jgi:hypothetical protein
LFEDISKRLKLSKFSEKDIKAMLTRSIDTSAKEGHLFTHTGASGVFKQRHKLPTEFHEISKHKIERLV